MWLGILTPTRREREIRNSNSAASPQSPAGSTNSTGLRSRTTDPPLTSPAPSNAGSRLPRVRMPRIAPRRRISSSSFVAVMALL
ncbi:MAG: hypothetical protein CYG60_23695 [Actinobacteria bacterium]|nr:MAG: hypothetical protein CYG60_23695 [Actinomycetota bacterium]